MKKALWVVLLLVACRTEIAPLVKGAPVKKLRARNPAECEVRDYPTAVEVPSGSTNIGWVKVPRAESDEVTFQNLRTKVCELGGDAMSQMRWVRASGASVADDPIELEGNAWATP